MSHSSSSHSTTVKRACDACHRRKVRCIGDGPRSCRNCSSSGLTCTYDAIPQKKGPKGSRAKVIAELRETQRQSQLSTQRHGENSPPSSPTWTRKQSLVSREMVTTCVDFFFAELYSSQPILHRRKFGETVGQMESDPEAYCLVVSLCGYMLLQSNMEVPSCAFGGIDAKAQSNTHLGRTLTAEAIRVRKGFNYVETPSVLSVITSFFLFGSYFNMDLQGTAWFHLREATTLALTLGMHEEGTYRTDDTVESSRTRRLYWLLFITERAYALQQHRPLSLHATINLPTLEDDPSETVELNGFFHLVNLYRPFDDTFVGFWNKHRVGCTTEWLARLQQELSDALPSYLRSTETQAADLRCSQQWLRIMVWQLSINHGFLSSAAEDDSMSLKFPISISRNLVSATNQCSQQSMENHGIGLVEKLFDIAYVLVDIISYIPYEQENCQYGPREYLSQIMSLISGLRGGQQRYVPLLISKIRDTMPNAPVCALSSMAGSSTVSEARDGSQNSTPDSSESYPFASPPLSAVSQHPPLFGAFQQELGLSGASTPCMFPPYGMNTGIDYADLTVSAPQQVFSDTLVFQGSTMPTKFESRG